MLYNLLLLKTYNKWYDMSLVAQLSVESNPPNPNYNPSLIPSSGYEIIEIESIDPILHKALFSQFECTKRYPMDHLKKRKILVARSLETNQTFAEYIGILLVRPCDKNLGHLHIKWEDKTPFKYDNTCILESIEVVPHWQQRKVGTQLVVNGMKKAASAGLKYMQAIHPSWSEELEAEMENPYSCILDTSADVRKEILSGKTSKIFFEKLPGFLPESCDNSLSQRARELRVVKYDLEQINQVPSMPLSNPEKGQKREKLCCTANFKNEPLTQECEESNKGLVFQIWEGETLRGTLLGTVHHTPEKYLRFRTAIREGMNQCSMVLCESYSPSELGTKPGFTNRIQYSNGIWMGAMEEDLISLALSKDKPIRGLEDSPAGTVVRIKVNTILQSSPAERRQPIDETTVQYFNFSLGEVWAKGNLEEMGSLKKDLTTTVRVNHFVEDCEVFVNQRNKIQAQGILDALAKDKEETIFAMVGASHLPDFQLGSTPNFKGVISILQENGYRVTQI